MGYLRGKRGVPIISRMCGVPKGYEVWGTLGIGGGGTWGV